VTARGPIVNAIVIVIAVAVAVAVAVVSRTERARA
jgi:hypothetical protein